MFILPYQIKNIHKRPFNSESQESIKIISKRGSLRQYSMKKTIVITWLMRKYNPIKQPGTLDK